MPVAIPVLSSIPFATGFFATGAERDSKNRNGDKTAARAPPPNPSISVTTNVQNTTL